MGLACEQLLPLLYCARRHCAVTRACPDLAQPPRLDRCCLPAARCCAWLPQHPCNPSPLPWPLPQAHEDKHVAEQLQRKEEELGEMFAGKRPVGSSARLAGKQATLTAMAKRLKR